MATMTEDRVLTVDDLADELKVGRYAAYALCRRPGFPSFRVGKSVRISRHGLERWIETNLGAAPTNGRRRSSSADVHA